MTVIDDIVARAEAQIGKPYVLGTEGPSTFDCSGLMWWVFDQEGQGALIGGTRRRAAGYTRWFADQGQFTRDFRRAQRGDMIVYENPVGHVGLYLGGGQIISALVPPYGVRRTGYNRISVPFYGVLLVDYGDARTGDDDADDTTGDEDDTIYAADPDWSSVAVEFPHGRAFWHIEFEDRPRRASGKAGSDIINTITRRRPPEPEPPPPTPDATIVDDTPLSLDVWQLTQQNIDYSITKPIVGSLNIDDHSFDYDHAPGATTVRVGSDIEGEVTWPFAGCGGLMPGWTGETRNEIWGELDLTGGVDADWLGLRIEGSGSDWVVGPAAYGAVAGATPIADGMQYLLCWGYPTPTGPTEYSVVVGIANVFDDWSVFVPRNLLVAGMNAFVIAPSWIASGWFCQQDLDDPGPGHHRPAIDGSGNSAVAEIPANLLATVTPVLLSGPGKTPWVPGDGDVDGTNATFELLSWDGTGAPEARIDDVILSPADYTFDAGAFTVTFREPPDTGASVTFRYNIV